jgi:hypothetical protein|tara:strand:+ start:1299 stop:1460 length:162 start_codon:yes stop_codon:yes gene_type:complete
MLKEGFYQTYLIYFENFTPFFSMINIKPVAIVLVKLDFFSNYCTTVGARAVAD